MSPIQELIEACKLPPPILSAKQIEQAVREVRAEQEKIRAQKEVDWDRVGRTYITI